MPSTFRSVTRLLTTSIVLLLCSLESGAAQAAADAARRGYYRFPALHGATVVFTAEGDLWRAPAEGGVATRLTTHAEVESRARISPDGRWLAFSASYEGPREVYVMPVQGGPTVRQTWEGGSADVANWTPDGRLLYLTTRYSTLPSPQLVLLTPCTAERNADGSVCSPHRSLLPLATAGEASVDADGTLFFARWRPQSSQTKRYVGGTAESIWKWAGFAAAAAVSNGSGGGGDGDRVGNGASGAGPAVGAQTPPEAVPLTADYPGTSTSPMSWNGRVWFLSDRAPAGSAASLAEHGVTAWDAGVMNIWSMNATGGDVRQHTFHTDYDVKDPALHEGRIVYQNGADLFMLDLRGQGASRRLDIVLASDFDQLRENWVDNPLQYLESVHVSPNGDRVVLVSRGRVFVAPVGPGRRIEVVREQGVRYRQARFLPDGRALLALSDESGEVELWTLPANGIGERSQLTRDASILRWEGVPSPNGRWIVHRDKNQNLYLYDTEQKTDRRIAHSARESAWISSAPGFSDVAWSADGRWLAYNEVGANYLGRIVLYDTERDTHTPVTSERYDSYSPVWSPDGKWLWFLSDRTWQSSVGSPWGAHQPDPHWDSRTRIYAVALTKDAVWPFRPNDELAGAGADTAATPASRNGPQAVQAPAQTTVDLDDIESRLYEVPVENGNYTGLSTDGRRLYFLSSPAGSRQRSLQSIEITRNDPKAAPVMENVAGYELSADRKKLMVRRGNEILVFDAGARAPQDVSQARVDLDGWTFSVDPREEWRHHFVDAWRLERDYFYDPDMHGVDWPAMRAKYAPLAERVTDRTELNDVLAQMVGELSALHIFVRGGDARTGEDNIGIATLGAVLERDAAAGGWRIVRIYRGDPDLPGEMGPLGVPGLGVAEGDVITAIDGVATLEVADPHVLLRNKAGRQTRLTIRAAARAGGAPPSRSSASARGNGMALRDVIVEPIPVGRESGLRYTEWEMERRAMVDELGGGRIGYVHLRAMGGGNMAEWQRNYYPVFNRDALIIDVRHNTGGNIDSWLLGKLMRREWFWWQPRVGEPYHNMPYAFRGPIVVLVDERTASDGEAFAEGARRLGLATVLGVRTWGGEIWLSSSNFLADRGIATAAEQGVFADGEWLIEGWGVEPDVVVDNLPVATARGEDAQLVAGVQRLLDRLRREPVVTPRPPDYPKRGTGAAARRGGG